MGSLNRGFTLIEILISLVILGSMAAIATVAFSIYTERWADNLGHFETNLDETRGILLIDDALRSIYPYALVEKGEDNGQDSVGFFFYGAENELTAVVSSGVFNYSSNAVAKLSLIDGQILYQEVSTSDQLILSQDDVTEFKRQLVLFDGVESVEFRYFGWANYKSKIDYLSGGTETEDRHWYNSFDGFDRSLLPEKFELTIRLESGQIVKQVYDVPSGSDAVIGRYFQDDAASI